MGDWLGTRRIADQLREYSPFEKARSFVRRLGLKSNAEWRKYYGSGKKPAEIPANPDRTYAEDGWVGWGDWLGDERRDSHSGARSKKQTREAPAPADVSP